MRSCGERRGEGVGGRVRGKEKWGERGGGGGGGGGGVGGRGGR